MPRAMARARKALRGVHDSMPQPLKHSRLGLENRFRFLSLWKERFHLSFSLFRVSTRISVYLIRTYIIELQILQLSLLQILQYPTAHSAVGAAMVAAGAHFVRGIIRGGLSGTYLGGICHRLGVGPSAMTKRPRPVLDLSQDQPGPCLLPNRHVSLMFIPYRYATSFDFNRYTSVFIPLTSSMTSWPFSR